MKSRPSVQNLEKVLTSLRRAVAQPKDEFSRDSVIQRFEFTLDLSWKAMKKFMEYQGLVVGGSPKDVVRQAASVGLIHDPKAWIALLDERNETSHSYNEEVAERVYQAALGLPQACQELLGALGKIV